MKICLTTIKNRIMKNCLLHIILLLLTGFTVIGCEDDLGIEESRLYSDYIRFAATLGNSGISSSTRCTYTKLVEEEDTWLVDDEKTENNEHEGNTRATLTKHLAGNVGLNAFTYSAENINYITIDEFDNSAYEFDGDILNTTNPVRWSKMSAYSDILFSAYAPYVDFDSLPDGSPFSLPEPGDVNHGKPFVYYSVPTDMSKQIDIIADTAMVGNADYNTDVNFSFEHILSAIRFKVGFDCVVNKIELKNIYRDGEYNFVTNRMSVKSGSEKETFSIELPDNTSFEAGDVVKPDSISGEYLILLPQTLPSDAEIVLTYDKDKTITSKIGQKGITWTPGKLITYTFHQSTPNYIYLDLALDNVSIAKDTLDGKYYSGSRYEYVDKTLNKVKVYGKHEENNIYYVYQTTASNRDTCGIIDGRFVRPAYPSVKRGGTQEWSQYIINNKDVNAVINNWKTDVAAAGRTGTNGRITVYPKADTSYKLLLDNVYSTYQVQNTSRQTGGISFQPAGYSNCKLTVTTLGDNRLGNIHYYNNTTNGSKLILEGEGSLTVADVIDQKGAAPGYSLQGYFANYYCSAIGGNDDGTHESCYGIEINSGTLFAGSTVSENCSAIGGGGNGAGEVTINGGIVTAVASTTGTAIGCGIGYSSKGGKGIVTINGGNVYAYNLDNRRGIPSSAIGGAGSSASEGTEGTVTINGGYVYAYSALGTAIGGGSSATKKGGDAYVYINGGMTIAESGAGAGIGGGSAYTGGTSTNNYNGGTATIKITGSPIIRTGSIGGGNSGNSKSTPGTGKIGSADITIEGGDIQAQFVMASGAKSTPRFTMSAGTIRNSDVRDAKYKHIKSKGGAVYMDFGAFTMTGGTIKNCYSEQGGAVYITDLDMTDAAVPTFTMTGGEITGCTSATDGGALFLAGGKAEVGGDAEISYNISNGGNGGGICLDKGEFKMYGSSAIKYNTSLFDKQSKHGGYGGGVYVSSSQSDVKVDILNGQIFSNSSNRNGGGICVNMQGSKYNAFINVGGSAEENPQILKNHTFDQGGGLYANGENANIVINNGRIQENSVSGYVDNPNVANIGGLVTLNGGDVTHINVLFDGNKGFTTDGSTSETSVQKIVTNTRTKLITPNFARTGWDFIGWNERADGTGKAYVNGEEIYRNTDLTLYAQWKLKEL